MIEKIQIVHRDFKESFESMPLDSVGRLTLALFRYANDEDPSEALADDPIAGTFFPTLKAHVERQEEYRKTKAESGRRGGKSGGAPIGNSNASKTKQNKAKQSETKQNKAPNPYPNPNPYPIKRHYGECANVLLTDEEYTKIKDKGYASLIEELSLYIASQGKDRYKNHYATICQWANKRKKETGNVKQFKPTSTAGENSSNPFNRFTQRDINFDEVAAKLIKN